MKKTRKIIVLAIVAMFIVSTWTVVASATSGTTFAEYYYNIQNGWHELYTVTGTTVNGSLYCEYNNGTFTAPSITSIISGAGDLNRVELDLYMWASSDERFEKCDVAASSLELTLKAGFWDSITDTFHWGRVYANDGSHADVKVYGE